MSSKYFLSIIYKVYTINLGYTDAKSKLFLSEVSVHQHNAREKFASAITPTKLKGTLKRLITMNHTP